MLDLETLVAPTAEPVSLAEARAWLRLGSDGDDDVLVRMIAAARTEVELAIGRALMARTVRERFTPLPPPDASGAVHVLPSLGPVTGLVAVDILDSRGGAGPAPSGFCTIAGRRLRMERPVPGIAVTYTAGASDPQAVSFADRVAVLEQLAALYARREAAGTADHTARQEPRL